MRAYRIGDVWEDEEVVNSMDKEERGQREGCTGREATPL